MNWIGVNAIYYLIGAILMAVVVLTLRDRSNPRRKITALFWFLFGSTFLFGDLMVALLGKTAAYQAVGVIVLLLAAIAGANWLGGGQYEKHLDEKLRAASRFGNKLFMPALLIPVVTIACTVLAKDVKIGGWPLFDPKNLTFCALALACVVAVLAGSHMLKAPPWHAVRQARPLIDALGWALILPQMLAMLGGVFVAAQTGKSIQSIITVFVDPGSRLTLVIMYCVGMALFTIVMGNAFAAFPVMTAGIGLPYLIVAQHANPAPVVAIAMFSGYCGTLLTPMAANYNIVPAALLELKDKYQVIKMQAPTAFAVLAVNIALMYFLAFPSTVPAS